MRILYYLLLSSVLCACGHNPTNSETSNLPAIRKLSIDKSLLVPCKPIPELIGSTEVELMSWISEWKLVYSDCKRDHAALISVIKSALPPDSK